MDFVKLASGDSKMPTNHEEFHQDTINIENKPNDIKDEKCNPNLKERIALCKNVIKSLKDELVHEKTINHVKRDVHNVSCEIVSDVSKISPDYINGTTDLALNTEYLCSEIRELSTDDDINCNKNLLEYEKQLKKYQNTLNIAQEEKKNAIRRQTIAKAFKLKLIEVENQCNVELLRVKQNLQCLEPLQLIASKWAKNPAIEDDDLNILELLPRYPEMNQSCIKTATNSDDLRSE